MSRGLALSVAVGLGLPTAVTSQSLTARAVVAAPRHDTRIAGTLERAQGYWGGGAFELDAADWNVGLEATRGRMTTGGGSTPPRDVGEFAVTGRFDLRSWLGVDVGYVGRAFSSAAGYQRWDIGRLGTTVSRDLGTPEVRAFVRLAYFPIVRIRDHEEPTLAVGSGAGVFVAPDHLPIVMRLSYSIERFRFQEAVGRAEQFHALTFSVGVRASHRNGRWTLGDAPRSSDRR